MFTLDQIKAAHATVKSGADFPRYIQQLIQLGVTSFDHFVVDGHIGYFGKNGFTLVSPPDYPKLTIADKADQPAFLAALQTHQQGNTGYFTFCADAAACGVEKWVMNMGQMFLVYYDKAGNKILEEFILSF